ncbi:MAG: hypothetical protein LBH54_01780 [Clostridiales bacterium]|jgi:S-formylglutathione hydrolase FrmB|nr:hypothetical protein [Clostridiales bacterium]
MRGMKKQLCGGLVFCMLVMCFAASGFADAGEQTVLYTLFDDSRHTLELHNYDGMSMAVDDTVGKAGKTSLKLFSPTSDFKEGALRFDWEGKKVSQLNAAVADAITEGTAYLAMWIYVPSANDYWKIFSDNYTSSNTALYQKDAWRWFTIKLNNPDLETIFVGSKGAFYLDNLQVIRVPAGQTPEAPEVADPWKRDLSKIVTSPDSEYVKPLYTLYGDSLNGAWMNGWGGASANSDSEHKKNGSASFKLFYGSGDGKGTITLNNDAPISSKNAEIAGAIANKEAYVSMWLYVDPANTGFKVDYWTDKAIGISNGSVTQKGEWVWVKFPLIADVSGFGVEIFAPGAVWLDDFTIISISEENAGGTAPTPTPTPTDPFYSKLNNVPSTVPAGYAHEAYYSGYFNANVGYSIYLPPAYEAEPQQRFPVVYILHGLGGNENGYDIADTYRSILDNPTTYNWIKPMILVLVNGVDYSWYTDSMDGTKPVRSTILYELIPHIDANYRTIASKNGRALDGFSMGGYGALALAFDRPDLFRHALSYAAAVPESFSSMSSANAKEKIFGNSADYYNYAGVYGILQRNRRNIIAEGLELKMLVGTADHTISYNISMRDALTAAGVTTATYNFDVRDGNGPFNHSSGYYGNQMMDSMNFHNKLSGSGSGPAPLPTEGVVITDFSVTDSARGEDYQTAVPQAETTVTVRYTAHNYTQDGKTARAIAAVYDAQGKLAGMHLAEETFTLPAGEDADLEYGFTMPEEQDFYSVKYYLWDGLEQLKPLTAFYDTPRSR